MAAGVLGVFNRKKNPTSTSTTSHQQFSSSSRPQRPPPLQLLPDALPASPDAVVIPHPSLMSRSGGGGRGGRSGGLGGLRAPAHYPSSYLTSLAPPPALSPPLTSLLWPPALLASLLKRGGGGKSKGEEAEREGGDRSSSSFSTMQLSVQESLGAALGTLLLAATLLFLAAFRRVLGRTATAAATRR